MSDWHIKRNCTLEYRLRAHSMICPDTGCWLWTRSVNSKGYGKTVSNKHQVYAHRAAYETWVGPIPPGLFVLHSCHRRSCINPAHLRVGTAEDNTRDMLNADRHVKGEKVKNSKLSTKDVLEIRRLYKTGGVSQRNLGEQFGVARSLVSLVVNNKRWHHVTEEAA